MDLSSLINHLMTLSPADKKLIVEALSGGSMERTESFYDIRRLTATPEWKQMQERAKEVINEEKSCLIHFDDHLQLLKK